MKKKALLFSLLFASWTMNSSFAAIYQVTTTTFAGAGSIQTAFTNANTNPGKDTIYFTIPGAGTHTITITTLTITEDVLIDGTSQPGYTGIPLIELVNSPGPGIMINTGTVVTGSEIRAIAVNGCQAMGFNIVSGSNKITGCYIGIGPDGVTDKGNAAAGIVLAASAPNNTIGGTLTSQRNIISGNNANGITIASSGNIISGNYLGTNAAGTAAVANNGMGIELSNSINNKIGGTTAAERNIISGNGAHGIYIPQGSGHFIFGNYIGTNAAGNGAVANGAMGIQANTTANVQIGGRTTDSSNLVSGNGAQGIHFEATSTNIRIYGNTVGLMADKTSALANGSNGIGVENSSNIRIGNTGTGYGNIISSNGGNGINIYQCSGIIIKSNILGTTASTSVARGNGSHGIQIELSPSTIIGGDHNTEGNIISASGGAGINFEGSGSKKTIVKGNYIGTDNSGTIDLGNSLIGIILKSDSCTIGGSTSAEGNILVGTKIFCGLLIADADAAIVMNNLIGTGLNSTPIPNKTDGINISVENGGQTSSNHKINYNTIAYNTENGINVGKALNNFNSTAETNNDLRSNSIYCNQLLGISLALTIPATQGNNGKIAPAINNALSTSSKVVGLANGLLPTDLVDIYEMSECINCDNNPQGKRYITTVSPDAAGNWSFDNGSPITGTIIAMATDAQGNSSQFSLCFTPCSAKAIASPTEYSKMMDSNTPLPITFTSSSEFSPLTPVAGKVYWTIGTTDTSGAALLSKASSFTLTFAPGGNGAAYGPGVYEIFLTAVQSGCVDVTKIKLNIFYIPNMITPNGDQKNDNWEVASAPGQFDARIYNRWGDLVYSKSDYTNEWNGAGLNDGVYYYLLEDKVQSGKSYKGWVQVIR